MGAEGFAVGDDEQCGAINCVPGSTCCGAGVVPPGDGSSAICCMEDWRCCGKICCDPESTCCGTHPHEICCGKGYKCCGLICCLENMQCGGETGNICLMPG